MAEESVFYISGGEPPLGTTIGKAAVGWTVLLVMSRMHFKLNLEP
jgi:hypothetical protein